MYCPRHRSYEAVSKIAGGRGSVVSKKHLALSEKLFGERGRFLLAPVPLRVPWILESLDAIEFTLIPLLVFICNSEKAAELCIVLCHLA